MEATFCFVDLAGFTALTEAHGDQTAAELLVRFTELVESSRTAEDRLVKTIGDAALLTSPTPTMAVQLLARLWSVLARERDFPEVRAGLHHGTAVEQRNDFVGATVNLAARLASHAGGGEIHATSTVAEAAEALGFTVASLGSVRMRNIRDPVELYALDLGATTAADLLDPVCRMRVQPLSAAGRLNFAGTTYWFCSLRCSSLFASSPEAYVRDSK
ncbi:MAG: adenylate/guanylate cyclase domain-containing protein [Candidatus Binatia bacterium]